MNTIKATPTQEQKLLEQSYKSEEAGMAVYSSCLIEVFSLVKQLKVIDKKSIVVFTSNKFEATSREFKEHETVAFSSVPDAYFNKNVDLNPIEALKTALRYFKQHENKKVFVIQTETPILQRRILMAINNLTI